MIPETTREVLEAAMARFDVELRDTAEWQTWEGNQSHKYAIEWNGRRYPVKKVVSLATGSAVSNFSGGEEANEFVTKLGFKVVPLPSPSAPIPKYWIFQGNPDRFDLERAIDELPEMYWLVKQYSNAIHQNDRVFMWLSGAEGGICATATILTEPTSLEEPQAERKFNRDQSKFEGTQTRVRLRIDARIQPRLTRSEIKAAPELTDLSILKFSNATNFEVSEFQTKAILRLLSGRESKQAPLAYWVEVTRVKGRPDREQGLHAFGKCLWSPKEAKDGRDIYQFMRQAKPGDVILHISDRAGITAVSRVAAPAQDFVGLPDTDWAGRPAFRIELRDFARLDPILSREVFFASPFKERLLELARRTKYLFYSGELQLNQGTYFTPAPPELVRILNDAYEKSAGKPLPIDMSGLSARAAKGEPMASQAINEVDHLRTAIRLKRLYFSDELIANYLLALQTKGFVILSGLSGTGKTQLAIAIAEAFAPIVSSEAINVPDGTEILTVRPYMFEHDRIGLPATIRRRLRLPPPDEGTRGGGRLDVVYPGGREMMAFWRDPESASNNLFLKGGLREWFRTTLEPGSKVLLRVIAEGIEGPDLLRSRFRKSRKQKHL